MSQCRRHFLVTQIQQFQSDCGCIQKSQSEGQIEIDETHVEDRSHRQTAKQGQAGIKCVWHWEE